MAEKIPGTMKEMNLQMWYALIGTNGKGLIKQFEELRDAFMDYVDNREDSCFFMRHQKAEPGKKDKRKSDKYRAAGFVLKTFATLCPWVVVYLMYKGII